MRTLLIALAGFAVVGGIGLATFALLPTADGGPLHPIQVNSPDRIEPIAPQQLTPPQFTRPQETPSPVPSAPAPAPTDSAGVPEPPPALWRDDTPGGNKWGDDGDDWGDDDGGDDDDSGDDD